MAYVLFKSDGSFVTRQLPKFVQQGNSGVDTFFVSIEGKNSSDYTCEAIFTLPTKETNVLLCTYVSNYKYDENEEPKDGYLFTLTLSQTLYFGIVFAAIRLKDEEDEQVLVTYPFAIVINETGVAPTIDTNLSLDQLDSVLSFIAAYYVPYANARQNIDLNQTRKITNAAGYEANDGTNITKYNPSGIINEDSSFSFPGTGGTLATEEQVESKRIKLYHHVVSLSVSTSYKLAIITSRRETIESYQDLCDALFDVDFTSNNKEFGYLKIYFVASNNSYETSRAVLGAYKSSYEVNIAYLLIPANQRSFFIIPTDTTVNSDVVNEL